MNILNVIDAVDTFPDSQSKRGNLRTRANMFHLGENELRNRFQTDKDNQRFGAATFSIFSDNINKLRLTRMEKLLLILRFYGSVCFKNKCF